MRRPPRWRPEGWSPFPPAGPKLPPPEHGIKIRAAGTTWWGARWIAALEALSRELRGRLARGMTYARTGRVHDLEVRAGGVRAKVTGTRAQPYVVEIGLAALDDATWEAANDRMAKEARFSAELLAGEMPKDVDEAFRACGASLFPTRPQDLVTKCSCPDAANPCKHVSATCYVLGDALDRDPFLLFELRGRTRPQVLEALRRARGAGARDAKRGRARQKPPPSGTIDEASYDAWRTDPPEASFTMRAPSRHGALLERLGSPPSWRAADPPWKALAPMVRSASERARAIALGAGGTGPGGAPAEGRGDFGEPFGASGV
jgi:uncharacterized Zn finger protein